MNSEPQNFANGSSFYMPEDGKRENGKLFTTWNFSNKLAAKKEKYELTVYFHNKNDELYFTVHNPELDLTLKNSDINKLKKDISDHIFNITKIKENIHWENWLEIHIIQKSPSINHNSLQETLIAKNINYTVRTIQKGFNPNIPGKEWTINFNGSLIAFPEESKQFENGLKNKDFILELPEIKRYIPDTIENRALLNEIGLALDSFSDKLNTVVGQNNLQEYLQDRLSTKSLISPK